MSDSYIIPPYEEIPAGWCHWPACADPVCERECPFEDEYIVACHRCGTAVTLATRWCPVCDRQGAEVVTERTALGDGPAAAHHNGRRAEIAPTGRLPR